MTTDTTDLRVAMIDALAQRGLIAQHGDDAECPATIYGQPAWRGIAPGHEPQALMDSATRQRDLVVSAYATPAAPPDLCAAWVEQVFSRLGLGYVTGHAAALYHDWCHDADTHDLLVGMIVATPSHPYSNAGRSWGHVGLYIGDRSVMHSVDGRVRTVPLELWLSTYGVMAEPRWGWLGGISLV